MVPQRQTILVVEDESSIAETVIYPEFGYGRWRSCPIIYQRVLGAHTQLVQIGVDLEVHGISCREEDSHGF
jgi:hypothetical protein